MPRVEREAFLAAAQEMRVGGGAPSAPSGDSALDFMRRQAGG